VIDPGPDVDDHVRALASRVADVDRVMILVTHGHADHAAAAAALAERTGAEILGPGFGSLFHGDSVETDEGALVAVQTPGHTREHLCFHWPARRSLFAGDLVLGEGATTWVAEYEGCVADYLASLERVEKLDLAVIYPAHGPALTGPAEALARFRAHRMRRIEQVRSALLVEPDADVERLLDVVYGASLTDSVRGAARLSLSALVDYVKGVEG
jgi:glyoxylase-like metal-dependent hydrolase (beta-lactamase superfamily II)